jgi:hypothetical protein
MRLVRFIGRKEGELRQSETGFWPRLWPFSGRGPIERSVDATPAPFARCCGTKAHVRFRDAFLLCGKPATAKIVDDAFFVFPTAIRPELGMSTLSTRFWQRWRRSSL